IATPSHGPILAGTFINLILYGVRLLRTLVRSRTYRHTEMPFQITVLFILDTINSVFNMIYIYTTLIDSFGTLSAIQQATWRTFLPLLKATIGALVQCFFGWRVSVLTGSRLMAVVVWVLAVTQCGAGLATGAMTIRITHFQQFIQFKSAVIVWLAGSAACDVYITIVLVWFLRGHKSGYKFSDDVRLRLLRRTIQTGLVTTLVATIDLILFLTEVHLAFNYTLAKLYTNSLLSSLNSRSGWAFSSNSHPSNQPPVNTFSGGPSSGRRVSSAVKQRTTVRSDPYV
ncbi:hypothetical protein K488DRAFT_52036, partial [Vararia minispora EC-137]